MSHERPAARESWRQRLPAMALYGALGLLVGIIGSFTHRSRFVVGDVTVWYGVVVALACALAFGIGLRAYTRSRAVSVGFASGVVAGIVFIALGFSNSVIILGDLVGMTWLVVAPLLVFGAAFWPRIPSRHDARTRPGVHPGTSSGPPPGVHPGTSSGPPPGATGPSLTEPFGPRGYPGNQSLSPFPPEEPKQ